jgi:NDP-sugar pyrophosphorylase family protein
MQLKGVILAAGKGTRIYPFSEEHPKPILPIANKPLMQYQIELMASLGIKDVIVVIGHLGFEIVRRIGQGKEYGLRIHYVEQKTTLGIAHAVGTLESLVDGPFMLFLGDIYFITNSLGDMVEIMARERLQGVLATRIEEDTDKIKRNFAVILDGDGLVKRVIEKPQYPQNNLKGCGIYLFSPQIFDAIRRTPRTAMRDEYEITDAIQILIDDGGRVRSMNVIERDMNLTYPQDLLELNLYEIARQNAVNILGTNTKIAPTAAIRNCVIGDEVQIGESVHLESCVVFDGVAVEAGESYVNAILTQERVIFGH